MAGRHKHTQLDPGPPSPRRMKRTTERTIHPRRDLGNIPRSTTPQGRLRVTLGASECPKSCSVSTLPCSHERKRRGNDDGGTTVGSGDRKAVVDTVGELEVRSISRRWSSEALVSWSKKPRTAAKMGNCGGGSSFFCRSKPRNSSVRKASLLVLSLSLVSLSNWLRLDVPLTLYRKTRSGRPGPGGGVREPNGRSTSGSGHACELFSDPFLWSLRFGGAERQRGPLLAAAEGVEGTDGKKGMNGWGRRREGGGREVEVG